MALLHIDGPVFRALLPVQWQDSYSQSALEASRYLAVLAEFEQKTEEAAEPQSGLNAKLDLALLWLARSMNTQGIAIRHVVLGLDQVSWEDAQAWPVGATGALQINLSALFPFPLQLPVQIHACEAQAHGAMAVCAQLIWENEELQDWYERTIFRYHRREIQNQRTEVER